MLIKAAETLRQANPRRGNKVIVFCVIKKNLISLILRLEPDTTRLYELHLDAPTIIASNTPIYCLDGTHHLNMSDRAALKVTEN